MILIALGANLPSRAGTPAQTLAAALEALPQHQVVPRAISPFYVTSAWPDPADPDFVNAVAQIETDLAPAPLMAVLHGLEESFGRLRGTPNAPRSLDLDLLDYDGRVDAGPPVLPHPRLSARGFVLVPLCDIAPGWRHPLSGKRAAELLAALPPAECMLRKIAG